MPLVQCQMCMGLSPQQAILQHYWGILQFTLILTLCIFLNVLSGAKFKGSVPGDCHWLHMSISGSRSPDYPQLLYGLAINQKFLKAASSGLMYLLEQLLKLREDECLLVE